MPYFDLRGGLCFYLSIIIIALFFVSAVLYKNPFQPFVNLFNRLFRNKH